jgi:magnesium transporter
MPRPVKKYSEKAGLSPGSLVHIGDMKIETVRIALINYDQEQLLEKDLISIEESFPYRDTAPVTWINVDGLHEVDVVEKMGVHFGIHPLVLEDIVHTGQRPKMENFEDYIYVVLKMLNIDPFVDHITAE